jgi:hypothetical protein
METPFPESKRPRLSTSVRPKMALLVRGTSSGTVSKSNSTKIRPTNREWSKRERESTIIIFRKLGLELQRTASGVWASQVLNVLGQDRFAKFESVRTPGKVIWCNFDLARQLGFQVPRTNQLTPEFHAQLGAALSLRAVAPADVVENQETITMYADRYGGEGVRPALGGGRAGFLPFGNLYVKGVGLTPLFKHDDPDDFAHSHGAVHLNDCLAEAVFGEVNQNLFSQGSARVLAIIDQGKHVTPPSGRRIPVALVVRAGAQLRPGHVLGSHLRRRRSRLNKFVSIARATGQLVTRQTKRTRRDIPDVAATMLRIIGDHARTAAESFRWRMIHGALTASNMEMSGAMLDLPTQSTQPRTAPIRVLDYVDSGFGAEHIERAAQLAPMYRALVRQATPAERTLFNIRWMNLTAMMEQAYGKHLQVRLLKATGLKTELAERIQAEQPALTENFTILFLRMAGLRNPGTTRAWTSTVESVSVLDVFHLLQRLPETHFAKPDADHNEKIRDYLKPVFKGNRFHVAKKQRVVGELINEFANLYRQVMKSCADYAVEYYGDLPGMQASIKARAAFENEPLDALYSKRLLSELDVTITAYRATGDPELVRAAIDQRITASLRSVDGLLAQGSCSRLPGGGVELERRTIEGVSYSVRAWNDGAQTRRLHVSIPVERKGEHYLSAVPSLPCLTKRQIQSLRYRFTTNGSQHIGGIGARLKRGECGGLVVDFDDLVSFPIVGRLEGAFYLPGSGKPALKRRARLSPYVFAIPDKHELIKLVTMSLNE